MVDGHETVLAKKVLGGIPQLTGLLWEKIAQFQTQLEEIEGVLTHKAGEEQSEGMRKNLPLKHYFEGGLYTRELFMPQGMMLVSMIHRQQHPSFLVKGKLSYLNDEGQVETIEAPHTVFTQVGTQRVFYVHKDSVWICVYKTNKTNVEDAEKEIYADSFMELPQEIINKALKICQESQQELVY
jgi:hypothetical protein